MHSQTGTRATRSRDKVGIWRHYPATNIAPLQGAKNPVRGLMFVGNSLIKNDPVRGQMFLVT